MIRCLIVFALLCSTATAQSIVTSGGNRSIVMSGAAAVHAPSGPSEAELLKLEIESLKSSLAAATAPHKPAPIQTPKPAEPPKQSKPVLRIRTIEACSPCRNMKSDIASGLFSDFDIEYPKDPSSHGYPLIEFQQDGQWRHLVDRTTWDNRGYNRSVLEDLKAICLSGVRAEILGEKKRATQTQVQPVEVPGRYVVWKGYTYDMENFSACSRSNCGMCAYLGGKQSEYFRLKEQMKYQPTSAVEVPDHQAPTPDDVISQTLISLSLRSTDVLADLGCGDARILIAAVQQFDCRAVGIEIDTIKAEEARRRVADSGLASRIEIITGDALEFEPERHGVTAIVAYLYEDLLEKLAPKFRQPGVRVVVTPFHQVPGLPMQQSGDVWVYRAQEKSSIFGIMGTSHESRETLIDHLLNDSIHRGKYSQSSLNAMSDEQLIELHERDHRLNSTVRQSSATMNGSRQHSLALRL